VRVGTGILDPKEGIFHVDERPEPDVFAVLACIDVAGSGGGVSGGDGDIDLGDGDERVLC